MTDRTSAPLGNALRMQLASDGRLLADAIAGCERRAHVLISGRPSDWEAQRDLALFCETLPVPDDVLDPRATEPSRIVVNVLRGTWPKQVAPREAPLVVTMLPLDDGRIARFARANGIASVETFLEALERNGLMRFARRPLDLQWLVDHWQANQAFGSLREMLKLSVNKRLTETNTQLARIDALTLDACNEAADRIGAAIVLQEVDAIVVPDSGLDRLEVVEAIDLAQLLPDWTSADRVKLISRAAFPPSRAGFVRLHNDNEGIVRSYLAARWFLRLLSANCPRARIHELLFAESYGVAVVIPSMVKTVAWLAISESWVAEEALRRDPISLLEFGDPASLPLDVRVRALRAAIDAPEDQRFARITNFSSLRRLTWAPLRWLLSWWMCRRSM